LKNQAHVPVKTNILINEHGKACLVDFGLAKALQSSANTTGTSALMGTLRWMAPELLLSSDADGGVPTFASDVYALAMVFYEARTPSKSLSAYANRRNDRFLLG